MRFLPTKFQRFAIFGCAAALVSYTIGLAGVNPAQAITDSRCSDGAFISHVPVPKNLVPDITPLGQSESTNLSLPQAPKTVIQKIQQIGTNLLPNAGLENGSGTTLADWNGVTDGALTASFPRVLGHISAQAARVDVTSYHSGSAYWSPGYQSVQSGGYYQFSDYYRSNVQTWGQVILKYPSGLTQSVNLGTTAKSTVWSPYTARFFVPVGVTQVRVSHNLSRIGALETDDYSLLQVRPAAFTHGLVSVAFIGAVESDYQSALPVLERYNIPATLYLETGFLDSPGYLTQAQGYDFTAAGDELASNTIDRANVAAISSSKLQTELATPKAGLSACYGQVTDFAAPFNAATSSTDRAIAASYETNLSSDQGFNSADALSPMALKVETVETTTTSAQIDSWISTAENDRLWLVLAYRGVDNNQVGLSRRPAGFLSDMQQLYASGVETATVRAGFAYVSTPSNLMNH